MARKRKRTIRARPARERIPPVYPFIAYLPDPADRRAFLVEFRLGLRENARAVSRYRVSLETDPTTVETQNDLVFRVRNIDAGDAGVRLYGRAPVGVLNYIIERDLPKPAPYLNDAGMPVRLVRNGDTLFPDGPLPDTEHETIDLDSDRIVGRRRPRGDWERRQYEDAMLPNGASAYDKETDEIIVTEAMRGQSVARYVEKIRDGRFRRLRALSYPSYRKAVEEISFGLPKELVEFDRRAQAQGGTEVSALPGTRILRENPTLYDEAMRYPAAMAAVICRMRHGHHPEKDPPDIVEPAEPEAFPNGGNDDVRQIRPARQRRSDWARFNWRARYNGPQQIIEALPLLTPSLWAASQEIDWHSVGRLAPGRVPTPKQVKAICALHLVLGIGGRPNIGAMAMAGDMLWRTLVKAVMRSSDRDLSAAVRDSVRQSIAYTPNERRRASYATNNLLSMWATVMNGIGAAGAHATGELRDEWLDGSYAAIRIPPLSLVRGAARRLLANPTVADLVRWTVMDRQSPERIGAERDVRARRGYVAEEAPAVVPVAIRPLAGGMQVRQLMLEDDLAAAGQQAGIDLRQAGRNYAEVFECRNGRSRFVMALDSRKRVKLAVGLVGTNGKTALKAARKVAAAVRKNTISPDHGVREM